MIRKIFIFVAALVLVGCLHDRFDRVENTPVSRYDIVYDDDMCGVFDKEAESSECDSGDNVCYICR